MIQRPFYPVVVLVRSLYESNIGASSRAMANMGTDKLILIQPQCEITMVAQKAAATGQFALQNRTVYSSWSEFLAAEPDGMRLGFTTKDGKGRLVEDFERTLKQMHELDQRWSRSDLPTLPIYLIFGPEDWGLSNDDIDQVHHSVSIPTFGDNPSLNLAQAVLLGLFILRTQWGGGLATPVSRSKDTLFSTEKTGFPEQSLKNFLISMGFDLEDRRVNAYSVFRKMLLRTLPSSKERRVLEIIFEQGARKLNERRQLIKNLKSEQK